MKILKIKDFILFTLTIIIGIVVDQISKFIAATYLTKVDTVPIIKDVLHLTYVENRGAAFGILKNHRWIFITVSALAIIVITVILFKGAVENRLQCFSLALIVSGGIGNMIDRLLLGYVVDFIDFRLINFAVFNLADSIVCIGAGILIFSLIVDIVKEAKKERS